MPGVSEIDGGSFRDPAGFVFRREGVVYRQVNRVHAANYDAFVASKVSDELIPRHLLIPHEEVAIEPAMPNAYRVLRPEPLRFVSYPYEWSFSQLRDAALATLSIQEVALGHGMSLRDASAYNIQFHQGRPLLIDTLSFEPLVERPWVAYRQFCSHFLAPLALMSTRDPRLSILLRNHTDGLPLDLTARLLPLRARIRPSLALHIFAHARSQRRYGGQGDRMTQTKGRFGLSAFRGLVDNLRSGIERLEPPQGDSVWSDYYSIESSHYSDDATSSKIGIIESFLDQITPTTVWDLGANTGRFSRLASFRGIDTVAFDLDPLAVEAAYLDVRARGDEHLLPLVLDLMNPSPGIGWANQERASLAERGPADLVLALALLHHLAIANNIPLTMIADHLASLGRHVVIEFVPPNDDRVRHMLSSREDAHPYTLEEFERVVRPRFTILRREPIAHSSRVLYLLETT